MSGEVAANPAEYRRRPEGVGEVEHHRGPGVRDGEYQRPAAADQSEHVRQLATGLLIGLSVAIAVAKATSAELLYEPSRYTPPPEGGYSRIPPDPPRIWPAQRPEPTPMFSSNDRSRWATVRALVDEGTYVIGRRVYPDPHNRKEYKDTGIIAEPAYRSLDIVMNPATGEFFSSKPPLFATLVAGEYWLLKRLLGWDIVRDRWLVVPTILLTVNVVPWCLFLVLLWRTLERLGPYPLGNLAAMFTAAGGTFLLTFAGTLNNHLPAACCVLFALYPLLRAMAEKRGMRPGEYAKCGFFAAMAFTFELPAAALAAAVGLPLLLHDPRRTLLYFVPAAAVPTVAFFAANYAAIGMLAPPYSQFGGEWYNFEGSHWAKWGTPAAKGIDFNQEPTPVYAFHLLLGHHGWFSLTPMWGVALAGLVGMLRGVGSDLRTWRQRPQGWSRSLLAAMVLLVSLVVFAFYLTRTQSYNYGGFTSGPRWLFWLIPLWLLGVSPAAEWLARRRWGRGLLALLLAASAYSVFYPAANPWRHPWILNLLEFWGVLRY